MKKIISLILAALILLNLSIAVFAREEADREYAKNKAKENVEINSAGLILGNEEEYIRLLSELIEAPEPKECAQLFEKAETVGVHPRIIATKEIFDNLSTLTQEDDFVSLLYNKQKEYTDNLLTGEITTLANENNDKLAYAREVMDRMILLGMMYQTTGEPRYYEFAQRQAEIAIKESTNWSNDVLQTAEMVAGMAIAYDWFFDVLLPSFKTTLKSYIVTKMRAISINYSPVPQGFARQVNNWNAVCNGAYGMAALAVFDEEPDLSSQILSGASSAIALSIDQFGPDGAFPEGPGYWAYQVQYITYFLSALDTAVKTDFGLSRLNGLKNTAQYALHMHGPTYNVFNYSDSGEGVPQTQYLYWFAKKYGYAGLVNYADAINPSGTNFSSWEFKGNDTFIMLWYTPSDVYMYDGIPTGAAYHGPNPAASMRTRWGDTQATYVGFKGGQGSLPHGNLDIGSFVIDSLGQRWVTDLGREIDYWLPGYFDYYNGGRWKFFVNRAEGHNTIVINPSKNPDQNPDAKVDISDFKIGAGYSYGVMDMTEAYGDNASSAVRGIALCGDSVLVKDELKLKAQSDVLWGMTTIASVEVQPDKRSAILSVNNKRMKVSLISPATATFDTMPAESLSYKAVPGSKDLSRYTRLISRDIYSGDVDIAVQFTAFFDGEPQPEQFSRIYDIEEWKNGNIYESNGIVKSVKLDGEAFDDFNPSKMGYTIALEDKSRIPVIEADFDRVNSNLSVVQGEKIGDIARIFAKSRDPRIGDMEYTFRFVEKKTFGKPANMSELNIINATASVTGAELAIDNRMDSCWACEGEQWLLLELGEKMPVRNVSIAFRSGLERIAYFDIDVSDDGENYTKVFSGEASGTSNDFENFKLDDVSARYVKITCKGSSTGAWASINEIALYN